MATLMTAEIAVKPEIRPAVYSVMSREGKRFEENVLVHTTKTSIHGGYLVEDEDGFLFEVVVDERHSLKFVDGLHKQYCFEAGAVNG